MDAVPFFDVGKDVSNRIGECLFLGGHTLLSPTRFLSSRG
jgi:hypothetical protein